MIGIVINIVMVALGVYVIAIGPNAIGYYVAYGGFTLVNVLVLISKLLAPKSSGITTKGIPR